MRNYASIISEVYHHAAVSACLNSPHRMARAGRNAKEITIPKIEVTDLGNHTQRELQNGLNHLRVRDRSACIQHRIF